MSLLERRSARKTIAKAIDAEKNQDAPVQDAQDDEKTGLKEEIQANGDNQGENANGKNKDKVEDEDDNKKPTERTRLINESDDDYESESEDEEIGFQQKSAFCCGKKDPDKQFQKDLLKMVCRNMSNTLRGLRDNIDQQDPNVIIELDRTQGYLRYGNEKNIAPYRQLPFMKSKPNFGEGTSGTRNVTRENTSSSTATMSEGEGRNIGMYKKG